MKARASRSARRRHQALSIDANVRDNRAMEGKTFFYDTKPAAPVVPAAPPASSNPPARSMLPPKKRTE